MNVFRWLSVPLGGIAVWYAVLLLGLAGVNALDSLCPPDLVVSGFCTAPWHGPAVETLVLLCTVIASAGVVVVPALIAPSHRFHVALLAYACGAAFAIYVAWDSLWGPFLVSGISGSAALWLAASRWRRHAIAG